MGDIVIRNIEIPKDNKRLALFIDKDGEVDVFNTDNTFVKITDAVELQPHGRLGDLDILERQAINEATFPSKEWATSIELIKNAPTILEASE